MAVKVIRKFRLLFDVIWGTPNDGDVPIYDAIQDKLVMGPQTGGGGGAPTTADYLVGTAQAGLSAEIVVGPTPGGELSGTWGSPTVDATHSGSSHADVQAAAEATAAAALTAHLTDTTDAHDASAISVVPAGGIAADDVQEALQELDTEKAAAVHTHAGEDITSGTVADDRIASTIARDSEVTSAISTSEAGQVRDGDAAGGVLSGTYPNPGFAADMATQAELDAHINDTTDAHDASAISILDTANDFTATDVEGALAELQSDHETDAQALTDHLADTADAHDASAISFSPTGTIAATDVQAAIAEVASEAGGGTGEALQKSISQTTHGLSVGNVVRLSGTNYVKAQADSDANAEVAGIVAAVADANTFTLHYGGRITGLSGLTAGTVYFLDDDTAGLLTATEPTDAGDISKPVLIADSTTTGLFFNMRGAVVAAALSAGSGHWQFQAVKDTQGVNVVQGTWATFEDASQPVHHIYLHNGTGTAQNDEITFPVALATGTYKFEIYYVKGNNCGILTLQIDGSSVGTIDMYNGSTSYDISGSITGIVVATAGLKTVSLKIATKNASSSNYRMNLTACSLIRTGA